MSKNRLTKSPKFDFGYRQNLKTEWNMKLHHRINSNPDPFVCSFVWRICEFDFSWHALVRAINDFMASN